MRGGALPAALACVSLALALGFAPRRAVVPACGTLVATAVFVWSAGQLHAWHEAAFLFCWASILAIAASVHLPRSIWQRRGLPLAILFAVMTGAASASVVAFEGRRTDLYWALALALLCLPARWLVRRNLSIGIKVVASWIMAVAILAALLPLAPTPGYVPDHMQ